MSTRFSPKAEKTLRDAIVAAKGVEVFAIGDMEFGVVRDVTVTCRGQDDRVTALLDRPRWGQVVIHNHPSGDLRPSEADMQLAGFYGDNGVGVIIVNSDVTEANWVVEPSTKKREGLDPEEVLHIFNERLPSVLDGFEPRDSQIKMAVQVAASISEERPLVVEAGTGTGKSLAYLIPAALWAKKNDAKVIISTHTKALQSQILNTDLAYLDALDLGIRSAVLQGRTNYLCKRRTETLSQDPTYAEDATFQAIADWSENTALGVRSDLPFPVDPELWEKVESDSDLTMRVRCPHYQSCHYYEARRAASGAHLVIVNHALLLSDLAIREQVNHGILPKYDRVILDEAHHLEHAATGAMAQRLTFRAIQRATTPLLSRGKKRGVIEHLLSDHILEQASLFGDDRVTLRGHLEALTAQIQALRTFSEQNLFGLSTLLPDEKTPLRILPSLAQSPQWTHHAEPLLIEILENLQITTTTIGKIQAFFGDFTGSNPGEQPLLDLNRARGRLAAHMNLVEAFLNEQEGTCRWLGVQHSKKRAPIATLNMAPVSVTRFLEQVLWNRLPGTAATSATLSVNKKFSWWMTRVGLKEGEHASYDSPFDHREQALLALPRDLPSPNEPSFLPRTAEAIRDAVLMSKGGTFILCTSYEAIRTYQQFLEANLPKHWPILVQSNAGKGRLLQQFKENPSSILIGTDSFWEGVDVRGFGLRQVIIPRLPFRVPTDPLQEAQHEYEAQQGRDPFRVLSLPSAVIKLRQGYGRLIRSQKDFGVVLILDQRIHHRAYGAIMLRSLPEARRLKLHWTQLAAQLQEFWSQKLPKHLASH